MLCSAERARDCSATGGWRRERRERRGGSGLVEIHVCGVSAVCLQLCLVMYVMYALRVFVHVLWLAVVSSGQ
jgi:hypothetical protein